VQHHPRPFLPELTELFEGLPSWASLRPTLASQLIAVTAHDIEVVTQQSVNSLH
jgi:hypothetical protein